MRVFLSAVFQRSSGPARQWPRARPGLLLLVLSCVLGWSTHARAEKADRARPLNFAADSARVDEHQQRNILSGNVELTKGTIILRADRVEIIQDRDGHQTASASGGASGRSYFRQKRDVVDEFIEGEAERIEYDSAADVVRFSGRATLRRLRGASVTDEVSGQTIAYNNNTDAYQVLGGPSSAASSGRVRGILAPRSSTSPVSAPPDAYPPTGAGK